jgi:hypothetical protein
LRRSLYRRRYRCTLEGRHRAQRGADGGGTQRQVQREACLRVPGRTDQTRVPDRLGVDAREQRLGSCHQGVAAGHLRWSGAESLLRQRVEQRE